MHIGFDISQTGATKAGCGYFAHGIISAALKDALHPRFSLYPSFGDFYFDAGMPEVNPYPASNVDYGPRHATLEEARAFWTDPELEARLGNPDIIHANNYWCPDQLRDIRLVYTLYDLSFIADPTWTTEVNRDGCRRGVSRAAQHADWILCISQASRNHFLQLFPDFPASRARVVYPCTRFTHPEQQGRWDDSAAGLLPGRFWLSVGTLEPRKNQYRIAEAYARYLDTTASPPLPLVFAGANGWMMEGFGEHLARLGILSHVVLAGYVADDELAWLYRNCLAHIYFSHFEGFGLPVLEGMQFGAATIASDSTSIPEVTGDAALLVKPTDTAGLTQAMLRLASDPGERERLSRAARARSVRFSWKSSATSLLALYGEAAASPKRSAHAAAAPL